MKATDIARVEAYLRTALGSNRIHIDVPRSRGASVDTNGILALYSGSLISDTISFVGSNDALVIAASTPPTNTISGFAQTDTIDLQALAYNVANTVELTSSNVLQINMSGGATVDLNLATTENYAGQTFQLISGAFGGTGVIVHS